ncbi:hypothetical protein ACT3CD_14885 [Geofilum sp. OHC36d9]|uniref:hypothetical protein n=1 Tax=Geofilum sp. OHC36d9 TaxID=3458413 RepID=UPI004033D2BE
MMTKIMHLLFLSCLRATELIEKQFHFKLSFSERLQLKIHKSMCKACADYEKQSTVLEHGIQKHLKNQAIQVDVSKLKQEIIRKLKTE